MDYRAYLLDEAYHIRAAENFAAECEDEAIEIASILHDACSDVFPTSEVWQGDTLIARLPRTSSHDGHSAGQSSGARLNIARRERHALELAERLHRSFACVRESRRLVRAMDDLKARLQGQPPPAMNGLPDNMPKASSAMEGTP